MCAPQKESGSKPLTVIGLGFADVFAGLFFLLLAGFGIVLAAAALSFGVAAVCLLGGLNIHGLLPAMPYWCGAILGLSLLALTALFAVGYVYYGAFLRQLIRSSSTTRWPTRPVWPRCRRCPSARSFPPKQSAACASLISLALFAAYFVLSYVVCALSAGSLQFWHVWGWFAN